MYLQAKVVVICDGAAERLRLLALAVRDGARARGAEVRLRRVGAADPCHHDAERHGAAAPPATPHASPDDLDWADVALFGTLRPDGVVGPDLKRFVDALAPLRRSGRLARNVYGAFAPATPAPRGEGSRLLALADVFHAWRGLVVPARCVGVFEPEPGGAEWTRGAATERAPGRAELAAARCHGRRATEAALALGASRRVLVEVA